MVGHDHEGVELQTILPLLLLEDINEEVCILFDLKESTAGGCCARYEVGFEFLWGSWHEEEGPGLKPHSMQI